MCSTRSPTPSGFANLLCAVYGTFVNAKRKDPVPTANLDLEFVGHVPAAGESRRLMGDYLLTENDTGRMTVVDPRGGPDCRPLARPLSGATDFRDPYPLDADCFLLAQGRQIVLMDGQGNTEVIHRLDHPDARLQVHEPRRP